MAKEEKKQDGTLMQYKAEMAWIVFWLLSTLSCVAYGAFALFCLFWAPFLYGWWHIGIFLILLLFTLGLLCPTVYFGFAPMNIFWTFVYEGTAKSVVAGGQVVNMFVQKRGCKADEDGFIVALGPGEKDPQHLFGGLRFYGIWPFRDIYGYDFSWTSVSQQGEVKEHPKEHLDYILLMDDVYWFKVAEVEDADLIPIDLEGLLAIRIVNPYRALFRVQDWLEMVINRVKVEVRKVITENPYSELIKKREALGKAMFDELKSLRDELKDLYGVELLKIEIKQINPHDEKIRELTLRKVTAEREREAIIVEADAEAKRIGTVYDAIRKAGPTGELLRTLEALEKSPENGSKWVVPMPNMADLLGRAFQPQPPQNPAAPSSSQGP
jgi:hypothetical protein